MTKPNVLALLGHPNADSLNGALWRAYADAARARGADVTAIALGDLDFDPILRTGYREPQPLEPDLVRLREAIEAADHVALFFPVWWAGPPALLKGALDRILLPGWAFRYEGTLPTRLLKGRTARLVTTMDSPSWWYRFVHGRAAHRAMVQATLQFVGFSPVRETTLYTVRSQGRDALARRIEGMASIAARDLRGLGARPRAVAAAG